uniref:Protein kinase domain-containing protein n=1 Tax=Megaviridae environmental sample TaxID=1737588 RepID=A0A5J6VKB8_9VIRU|nr:MAG: hypothetical protein [Megaviridae environmental sample]
MEYQKKYLKYKKKYLNLKNQTGGASNGTLDLSRAPNKALQKFFSENMILINDGKEFNSKVSDNNAILDKFLDSLMSRDEKDEINVDFLNMLPSIPYISEKFNILKSAAGYNFTASAGTLNYKIVEAILEPDVDASGGGGGDYIFLLERISSDQEVNGYPKNLVLKLFSIEFDNYKDYTPMNFHEVFPDEATLNSSYPRYQPVSQTNFKKLCMDEEYNQSFKNTVTDNDIYISCGLDNFQNEYVQNIILRKILGTTPGSNNLIKFYNFMYLNLTTSGILGRTNRYGAILMEKIDGTLYDILKTDSSKINQDNLPDRLKEYIDAVMFVKNNVNRFNHTDLKTQNIFIRKRNDGSIGDFLIADLDKSSITHNKIRFFNKAWLSKTYDQSGWAAWLDLFDTTDPDSVKINERTTRVHGGLQIENLVYRYNSLPFLPFFDLVVLYSELMILCSGNKDAFKASRINIIWDYYLNSTKKIEDYTMNVSSEDALSTIDHSDFGDIVKHTVITNGVPIPINLKNVVNDQAVTPSVVDRVSLISNSIYLVSTGYKLALTKPIKITSITSRVKTLLRSSYEYKCSSLDNTINNQYSILYTGNIKYPEDTHIIKTNRFNHGIFGAYEFQLVSVEKEIELMRESAGEAPERRESAGAAPERRESAGEAPERRESAGAAPERRESAGEAPERRESAGAAPERRESAGEAPERRESAGEAPERRESAGAAPERRESADGDSKRE